MSQAAVKQERTIMNECYLCAHMRSVPGNAHIQCVKPDPDMQGHRHGIKRGWFIYPSLFDPRWKTRMCNNYEEAPA